MALAKRKKRFFDVEIPLIKKTTSLQAYEFEELDGRFLSCDLTRLLRGKNAVASFKVKISGDKAEAFPREVKILPSFLRRMIRKGTNQVEDSFVADAKDGKITVKPFLITRKKVPRKIRKSLRDMARQEIMNYAKEKDILKIFDDVLKNSLQRELSLKLKKIYPLSLCEIRVLKIKD